MDSDTGTDEDIIEFLYLNDDYDEVAKPKPAGSVRPEWYDKLGMEDGPPEHPITVKKCIPFMEAMGMGWVIPAPLDIPLRFGPNSRQMEVPNLPESSTLGIHHIDQMNREDNPLMPRAIIKFIFPWAYRVPEGYSILFTHPMNRAEDRFRTFSGVVSNDTYLKDIAFPAVWLKDGYEGVIEKGTPVVQAIPFKRDDFGLNGKHREATDRETQAVEQLKEAVEENAEIYRDNFWRPHQKPRDIGKRE